jgi:hypothetical protein
VLGVCSGSRVLAATGMLDGRTATSHWSRIAPLEKSNPDVTRVLGLTCRPARVLMSASDVELCRGCGVVLPRIYFGGALSSRGLCLVGLRYGVERVLEPEYGRDEQDQRG